MTKRKSGLIGRYRITSMEMWDQEFVDEEVPGYIEFTKDGLGEFQFGYVRCDIDWREVERAGKPAVEFSFQGNDEMEPTSGRRWVVLDGGKLKGMFLFHRGDESGFVATRV